MNNNGCRDIFPGINDSRFGIYYCHAVNFRSGKNEFESFCPVNYLAG